jgi:hypothetical protein
MDTDALIRSLRDLTVEAWADELDEVAAVLERKDR